MSETATQPAAAAGRTGLSQTFVRTGKQPAEGKGFTQLGMEAKEGRNNLDFYT